MTDQKTAAAARSESCKANFDGEYPTCERCGLAWHRADPPQSCKPMNFEALRLVLLHEILMLESQHRYTVECKAAGLPADPVETLKRATALRFVMAIVGRCSDSKLILAELGRIARAYAEADQDKRPVKIVGAAVDRFEGGE